MATDPDKTLASRESDNRSLVRIPPRQRFPTGLFCASPTVLQAINHRLAELGRATLWIQLDGTIGPTDPLLLRCELSPSPFIQ